VWGSFGAAFAQSLWPFAIIIIILNAVKCRRAETKKLHGYYNYCYVLLFLVLFFWPASVKPEVGNIEVKQGQALAFHSERSECCHHLIDLR